MLSGQLININLNIGDEKMSTRCQVQVIQDGLEWEEKVTLYHHTDGYPENMIPLIHEAFTKASGWEGGRAGKAASYLCAADPGTMEPEAGHELHGDIEYLYHVYCTNSKNGSLAESARWEVEIYKPKNGFWDHSVIDNMKLIDKRQDIEFLLKKYKED
jgi:hypothetical protein